MTWPLINSAADDAKKHAARATSAGWPHRARSDSRFVLLPFVRCVLSPLGAYPTRGEAIHAHLRRERLRKTASCRHHGALNGGKHLTAIARHSSFSLVPAHVEDHSATAVAHPLTNSPRHPQGGDDVNLPQRRQFIFERPLGGVACQHVGSSIVDPDIDRTPIPRGVYQTILLRRFAKIGQHDARLSAKCPHMLRHILRTFCISFCMHHDVGTSGR